MISPPIEEVSSITSSSIEQATKKTASKRFMDQPLIDQNIFGKIEAYANKVCIYIIQLNDYDYKYGHSSRLQARLTTHRAEFSKIDKYPECTMFVVRAIIYRDSQYDEIVKNVELSLRSSIKNSGERSKMIRNQHEIITLDNLEPFIERIEADIDKAIMLKNNHQSILSGSDLLLMVDKQIELARIEVSRIEAESYKPIELAKIELEILKANHEYKIQKLKIASSCNTCTNTSQDSCHSSKGIKVSDSILDDVIDWIRSLI